jgi:uncharacterized repeat protein (TIGR01451 family)
MYGKVGRVDLVVNCCGKVDFSEVLVVDVVPAVIAFVEKSVWVFEINEN